MRLTLSVLFMAVLLAVPAVVLADTAFEREARNQAAAADLGTGFLWPEDPHAADPGTALQIITEAAEATGSNVLRTSVGTAADGRKRIAHYVFIGGTRTGLFDDFALAEGRWLTPEESRGGSATVSSARIGEPGNVGAPAVFADRYELAFAPLGQAFESLPVAGRYVVEAPDTDAAQEFLAIVRERLLAEGVAPEAVADLERGGAPGPVEIPIGMGALAYLLSGAAVLVAAFIMLREGKRIGVLRLMGHSPPRIWYQAAGRLQLIAMLIGLVACGVVVLAVPGADAWFVRALAAAWAEASAAAVAATLALGLFIVHRVQLSDLIKGSLQ